MAPVLDPRKPATALALVATVTAVGYAVFYLYRGSSSRSTTSSKERTRSRKGNVGGSRGFPAFSRDCTLSDDLPLAYQDATAVVDDDDMNVHDNVQGWSGYGDGQPYAQQQLGVPSYDLSRLQPGGRSAYRQQPSWSASASASRSPSPFPSPYAPAHFPPSQSASQHRPFPRHPPPSRLPLYEHLPLPGSDDEHPSPDGPHIRLLVLEPGSLTDRGPLRARIKTAPLSARPQYAALSYAWGENTPRHILVVCNEKARDDEDDDDEDDDVDDFEAWRRHQVRQQERGRHGDRAPAGNGARVLQEECDEPEQCYALPITANLYSALRFLRLPDAPLVLWVDAVCIDQRNNNERSSQVALMGRIYSLAERVLVWLGEEEEHEGERAFGLVAKLDRVLAARNRGYASTGTLMNVEDFIAREGQAVSQVGDLGVLRGLFARPWFRRLWVAQEVIKAREGYLVLGQRVMPLDVFTNVIRALVAVLQINFMAMVGMESLATFMAISHTKLQQDRYRLKDDDQMDIVNLIFNFRWTLCADPRDRIYALLGLAWSEGLVPDYGDDCTLSTVMHRFVRWCITTRSSLRFLSIAGSAMCDTPLDDDKGSDAKPSWFPVGSIPYAPSFVFVDNPTFNATLVQSAQSDRPALLRGFDVDETTLTLHGARVDEVAALTHVYTNPALRASFGVTSFTELSCDLSRWFITCATLVREALPASPPFEENDTDERFVRLCNALVADHLVPDVVASLTRFMAQARRWVEQNDTRAFDYLFKVDNWIKSPAHLISRDIAHQRHFAVTTGGRFAWLPRLSQKGDVIIVFRGARVPFVVRPRSDGSWTLVGECYVQGLMRGEALQLEGFRYEKFSLK